MKNSILFGTVGIVSGLALCTPTTAFGLAFNITYTAAVQADPNYANIQSAVNYVKAEYSGLYSDPVTLNFTIDEGTVGLGQSLFSNNYWRGSYTQLAAALIADKKTTADGVATAAANLPAADPYTGGNASTWYATSAEAKALGLLNNQALFDGTYTFDTNKTYTYDPNNRGAAGKYDFIGVTEHEFSELMGRTSQSAAFGYDILDTMRFTAPGVRQPALASGVYYSYDNGITAGAGYNSGGGDRQDFDGSILTDPFNAGTSSGQAHVLSTLDKTEMDVIGWDMVVPEPGTASLFVIGLATWALRRARNTRQTGR
jgi:hypothetical protein